MTINDSSAAGTPPDQRAAALLRDVTRGRLSRREVLRRAVALGLAAPTIGWLLAACGGSGDKATGTTSGSGAGPAATTASGSPVSSASGGSPASGSGSGSGGAETPSGTGGGRLTLILPNNVPDLDPQSAYFNVASAVFRGPYELLLTLKGSDTASYEPQLATEWTNNADFSEWTFKIAPNVTFHDGTPCDAAAVVKSFQRFHQMGLGPVNVITRFVDKPEDITAPDATTVTFKLKTGNEIFLAAMASIYGPFIVSPAAVDANKTADDPWAHEWFSQNCVGTGPYKVKENIQNDHITLERFADYHGGWDGPHFDEIVFRIVPENAVRRQLVEGGDADATSQNLTPKDVTAIEQAGKLSVLKYDSTAVYWTQMNGVKIADPKARQGFSYAFPYDDVRTGVYEGLLDATSGPCTPTTRGYDPNGFIYTTDMDKAKSLLTEANWDFSKKLEYWVTADDENDKAIAQLFQDSLSKIGIQLDIVQKEGGAFNAFFYGDAPGEERPEFFAWSWWPDYNDGYNEIYPNFYSKSDQTSAGPNAAFYADAQLDKDLDEIAPGVPEAQYTQLMTDANTILTQTNPGGIFWGAAKWYTVIQPNIKGFVSNPIYINTYNLYDMYRA